MVFDLDGIAHGRRVGDDVDFVVIESDDDGNVEIREGDWEVDGDSDDEWEEYDDWDEEEF